MLEERVKLNHLSKEYKEAKLKGLIDTDGYLIQSTEVTKLEENQKESLEEPKIPLSDVKKMMAEMKLDILNNIPSQSQPVLDTRLNQPLLYPNQIRGIEDIPELRNWERKERRYEIIDSKVKSQSESIHTRPTPQRPLNYINKETNTQHPIRYSTNQMSFFVEKQSTEPGSVLSPDIIFTFGMLNTSEDEILLQQFLHIHPDYGKKFQLYNPTELAEKRIQERKIRHKAEDLVYNFGLIENRAIASLVFPTYTEDWEEKTITDELLIYIETNANKYIEFTEDPTLKKKGVAKTAMADGLLIYQNYRWLNKDKEVLVEVPKHKNEFDAIAEFFDTDRGRLVFDYLRNS